MASFNWPLVGSPSVYLRAAQSLSGIQALPPAVFVTMIHDLVYTDTYGAYNNTTGIYTVPIAGYYQMAMMTEYSTNSLGYRELRLRLNGSDIEEIGYVLAYSSGPTFLSGLSSPILCNQGDRLSVVASQAGSGAILLTNTNGPLYGHFGIARLP